MQFTLQFTFALSSSSPECLFRYSSSRSTCAFESVNSDVLGLPQRAASSEIFQFSNCMLTTHSPEVALDEEYVTILAVVSGQSNINNYSAPPPPQLPVVVCSYYTNARAGTADCSRPTGDGGHEILVERSRECKACRTPVSRILELLREPNAQQAPAAWAGKCLPRRESGTLVYRGLRYPCNSS